MNFNLERTILKSTPPCTSHDKLKINFKLNDLYKDLHCLILTVTAFPCSEYILSHKEITGLLKINTKCKMMIGVSVIFSRELQIPRIFKIMYFV